MENAARAGHLRAGVIASLVGYTSSFAVVLTGLRAVGATPTQAASGLMAMCLVQAVCITWLATRHRMPIALAWSTPGAALLAGTGAVEGGWSAAVGAFALAGVGFALTGLWPALGRLVASIPAAIAQAMLAGVVLALCLEPVTALVDQPWAVTPIVVAWLLGARFFPRWAVPGAFVVAGVVIAVDLVRRGEGVAADALLPRLDLTAPTLTWAAVVGIALPLFVVTMASQNVPGVAIMASYGYRVPWRDAMVTTGVGTVAGAAAGGHAVNLAAISAALVAGPDGGDDPAERWRTARAAAGTYVVLGLLSSAIAAVVLVAPPGVVASVAGLALLGTLAAALQAAVSESTGREVAVVTFLVAASGTSIAGIGAAFWAVVAGLVVHVVLRRR